GAMRGEVWVAHRNMPDRSLVLSVALPVTRYKQTLGVLMLSKTSADIDNVMFEVRKDTLQVFTVTLIFTVLVSLYLGGTIARPIRNLSRAAERIRIGHHREHTIPNMQAREDEIGDLASALNEMTEALWARMDAIEAFAADVSHEIKNPLTSLKSAVETTRLVKDPEQLKKLMEVIQEDVERLDRLITDISDASRLDAELSRSTSKPVDLGDLLATLVDIHNTTSEQSVHLDVQDGVLTKGSPDRLMQVWRNLLSNAISFTNPNQPICIKAWAEKDWVCVTVQDTGPGLAPGKEQAIFDRFYSERPEGEDFGRHSGLGLSISLQIIEAHGGTLKAETLKDESGTPTGSLFTVRLPSS
ncbi:MAG: HAMP domain-containing histidine kinase, partial [Magnetovibrio sp.]|nr:HAMP domain-containing histidine kinase [Magnetovibrio sp.]